MSPLKIVPAAFVLLAFSLFFISCSDEETSTNSLQINGKVVDAGGFPPSPVLVSINNAEPVQTGADGSFSVTASSIPYDIMIFNSYDSVVTEYQQLSSVSPVLRIHTPPIMMQRDNTAGLKIKHPKPANGKSMRFALVSGFDPLQIDGVIISDDTTFNCGLKWPSYVSSLNAWVVVMVGDTINGNLASFSGYGAKQFAVSGNSQTEIEFTPGDLTYVPPQQIVQVYAPQNYPDIVFDALISIDLSYGWGIQIVTGNVNQMTNLPVPTSLSLMFNITLQASDMSFKRSSIQTIQPGTNAQLTFGNDVNLLQPPNGATGVNEQTQFSVDAGTSSGFYSVTVGDSSWFNNLKTQIYTKSPVFHLPNFARFGLSMTSNRYYSWNVNRIEGFSSINEFASWNSFKSIRGNKMWTMSENRTFRYGQ